MGLGGRAAVGPVRAAHRQVDDLGVLLRRRRRRRGAAAGRGRGRGVLGGRGRSVGRGRLEQGGRGRGRAARTRGRVARSIAGGRVARGDGAAAEGPRVRGGKRFPPLDWGGRRLQEGLVAWWLQGNQQIPGGKAARGQRGEPEVERWILRPRGSSLSLQTIKTLFSNILLGTARQTSKLK